MRRPHEHATPWTAPHEHPSMHWNGGRGPAARQPTHLDVGVDGFEEGGDARDRPARARRGHEAVHALARLRPDFGPGGVAVRAEVDQRLELQGGREGGVTGEQQGSNKGGKNVWGKALKH